LSTLILSALAVLLRKYSDVYKGVDQGIDHRIFCELINCCLLFALSEKMTLEWKDIFIGGVAGTLIDVAIVLCALGIAGGKGGPAQALMSTNALWQAVFGAAFAGQTMGVWQIIAMILGLLGVFSISYFDHLANRVTQYKLLSELRRSMTLET